MGRIQVKTRRKMDAMDAAFKTDMLRHGEWMRTACRQTTSFQSECALSLKGAMEVGGHAPGRLGRFICSPLQNSTISAMAMGCHATTIVERRPDGRPTACPSVRPSGMSVLRRCQSMIDGGAKG